VLSWGDQKGLDSLRHALAENNPNRLYIFESTALGYNLFFDMWEEAKERPNQHADLHRLVVEGLSALRGGQRGLRALVGRPRELSDYEAEAATEAVVLKEYGWQITKEQWAWYRHKRALASDDASFLEEQPSTEHEAFQATGNSFFQLKRVTPTWT
jgi:hypothetical protein